MEEYIVLETPKDVPDRGTVLVLVSDIGDFLFSLGDLIVGSVLTPTDNSATLWVRVGGVSLHIIEVPCAAKKFMECQHDLSWSPMYCSAFSYSSVFIGEGVCISNYDTSYIKSRVCVGV